MTLSLVEPGSSLSHLRRSCPLSPLARDVQAGRYLLTVGDITPSIIVVSAYLAYKDRNYVEKHSIVNIHPILGQHQAMRLLNHNGSTSCPDR